jgi:hypothetical protein
LFKEKVGGDFVRLHDYEVSREGADYAIAPENWSQLVKSGVVIEMVTLLRRQSVPLVRCPACCRTEYRAKDGQWIKWFVI